MQCKCANPRRDGGGLSAARPPLVSSRADLIRRARDGTTVLSRRPLVAISALSGAALVLVVLALAGVFGGGGDDGGNSQSAAIISPAFGQGGDAGKKINRIYERSTPAVVFNQARISAPQTSPFGPAPQQGEEARTCAPRTGVRSR
jgi:hypothetical protein